MIIVKLFASKVARPHAVPPVNVVRWKGIFRGTRVARRTRRLKLLSAKPLCNGAVAMHYRRAR